MEQGNKGRGILLLLVEGGVGLGTDPPNLCWLLNALIH